MSNVEMFIAAHLPLFFTAAIYRCFFVADFYRQYFGESPQSIFWGSLNWDILRQDFLPCGQAVHIVE